LEEVVIAVVIALTSIIGILAGYRLATYRAQWAVFSEAAQWLAMQRIEQVRSARWEPLAFPPVDELVPTNFPETVSTLSVPVTAAGPTTARLVTTISNVSSSPPLKFIQVDCIWSCGQRGPFTNRAFLLRSPDL
jgi:Tfp pilus assembly protein PilV